MPPPADAQLHTTLTSGITNEWEQIQNPGQHFMRNFERLVYALKS